MSQTIDERVVEMRFDNKQFEQGTKETMATLEKLKKSLDLEGSAKSFEALDKAANSVSLEGIASGIEALQKRFSTLGIVGMRVIENITDSLMKMASNAMGYVSDAIISGGLKRAQNIENAHFQLQALLKDEEAVQAVMDNAMASVDGTAYAYDEAAKAASQFAASGMRAGEEMEGALRAITGVAAMTNSEYEGISRIFTTVAGNGRLMGDQLLQLSSRGLNAAATVADYFREVQGQTGITESKIREMVSDGEISFQTFAAAMDWAFGESAFRANETFTGALSNMRSALARIGAEFFSPLIEQNSDLIMLINTVRERINDIKKGLTFDEQRSAISGLTKVTGLETAALEEMFGTIDKNGAVSKENLLDLSKQGINATKNITDYLNGVVNGTIRTTYANKTAISELTKDMEVNEAQVRRFVENGQIDLKMFTGAMETAYGDQKALSKQFTESFLNAAKSVSEFLKTLDLSKPLAVVYYGVETIKNVFKGLYSILKPLGKAFADVFLSFKADDVVNLAAKIERLTAKMKLSEKGSKNLQDAFKGVFSVVKLVVDAIAGLIGIVIPVGKPIGSLTDLILALAGALGRGLSAFTDWINKSPLLNRAYDKIAAGVQKAMSAVAGFISNMDEFVNYIYNLPITQKIIAQIIDSFNKLYLKGGQALDALIKKMKEFSAKLAEIIPDKVQTMFNSFVERMKVVWQSLQELDLSKVIEGFHKFTDRLKDLVEVFKGNKGIDEFVKNLKQYFKELGEAFTFDALFHNIEKFKEIVGGFVDWFRKTIGPIFDGFSIGGVAATAGGFGILYVLVDIMKTFNKLTGSGSILGSLDSTLNAVRTTLVAYQKDLKADMMLKIAKSITLLAVALTVLSFADTDRIYSAAVALGAIGAALTLAVGYLMNGVAAIQGATATIYTVANTFAKSVVQLGKAVKWKAIGSAIKDMAISIGIIIASVVALAYAYSKDPDNIMKSLEIIGIISAVMVSLIVIMSAVGNKLETGMKAFRSASVGVLALCASLVIVISALEKLFNLELPADWETKMTILAAIFVGLSGLAIVVALASKIASSKGFSQATGNSASSAVSNPGPVAGPIIAAAAALYLSVLALEKLFKMDIPTDYQQKLMLLGGLFAGIVVLIIAVGVASKLAKNKIKATGSLLAMCAVIVTMVAALMVLSLFPGEKLFNGAINLGLTLIALGVALSGAGKIVGKDSWKTVLAMAMEIGVITAAIGVLSLVSFPKLLKAAGILGALLLVLAVDFLAVSKITNELAYASILAMAANVAVIAVSLYVLSEVDWKSLLSAAGSLGVVLLAVAGSFAIISKAEPDTTTIFAFLSGAVGVMVIAYAISTLANYPWEGMLSAAASLGIVLLAMGKAMNIIGQTSLDLGSLAVFAVGLIGVYLISKIICELANQPWDGMLAAAGSIAMVLIGLAIAMNVCTIAGKAGKAALVGIGLLDVFIADLAIVVAVLGKLAEKFGSLWSSGGAILMDLGTYLGTFVGNIISGISEGISSSLSSIGQGLSDFANNAQDFFDIMGGLDDKVLTGTKNLTEAILYLTGASVLNGIGAFMGGNKDFAQFGEKLKSFGTAISAFAEEVTGISGTDVEAASNCALAMAELYSNLPKEDGWIQKITGQKESLADFAEELKAFGTAIAEYSEAVDGKVSKEAVEASTAAAEVLLTFNDKLPNMGGLKGKIFGNQKTLEEFAVEFTKFGAEIVNYCQKVDGNINQGAVQASIDAAEILWEFNEKLPETGGLAQLLFGHQKTLAELAAEIIPFGQNMVDYCEIVAGNISPTAVRASTYAAEALVELQNGLEKSGGIISWFTGDKSLADFGSELKKFGKSLADYNDSIAGIDPSHFSSIIEAVGKLVDISSLASSFNTSGITSALSGFMSAAKAAIAEMGTSFESSANLAGQMIPTGISAGIQSNGNLVNSAITNLSKNVVSTIKTQMSVSTFSTIGQNIVNYIITGINAKKALALTTVKNLCTAIISQFKTSLSSTELNSLGQSVVQALINGMNAKKSTATSTANNIANAIISEYRNILSSSTFNSLGQNIVQAVADGMNAKRSTVVNTANSIAQAILDAFNSTANISAFNQIGENIAVGMANGISSNSSKIKDAANQAAQAAIDSAMKTLNEHSPSKVFYKIGEYISIGLAKGIISEISAVGEASEEMAKESTSSMNGIVQSIMKTLDENQDFEPVIRPVLDLSMVEEGFTRISDLFNSRFGISTYNNALAASSSFSGRTRPLEQEIQSQEGGTQPNVYQFNQYNNSPKALSRVEIYRQTKNLFSTWKGVVESQ